MGGQAGYSVNTSAAVALAAGTAKTILGVNATANFGCVLKKYRISFDGVTASAVPVYVEICNCTFATNVPGTNSTSETIWQNYGKGITAGFTGARAWTAANEPTVISPLDTFTLTPNGGTVIYDFPLGDCPDVGVSNGFVIRCTAPAIVNARGALWFERA
jgi:hypothetical protein